MPVIHVEMWKGATKEMKAAIAKEFTETLSRIAKKPPEYIDILFTDYEMQNWAKGGELASDIDWGKRRREREKK
jgi:4-oxalocrotonate tautomerase